MKFPKFKYKAIGDFEYYEAIFMGATYHITWDSRNTLLAVLNSDGQTGEEFDCKSTAAAKKKGYELMRKAAKESEARDGK